MKWEKEESTDDLQDFKNQKERRKRRFNNKKKHKKDFGHTKVDHRFDDEEDFTFDDESKGD